jgi:hypothetical protein
MVGFHLGSTKLPGALRFNSGWSRFTSSGKQHTTTHLIINPLRRVFGISWKAKWFFGVMTFDDQTYERPTTIEDVTKEPRP